MSEQVPCPRCGYVEGKSVAPVTNHMHEYVDEKTGKSLGIINSNEDKMTVKGQSVVKKHLFVEPPKAAPANPLKK